MSNDGFNANFDVITILPLTKQEGKQRKPYVFEVLLEKGVITDKYSSIVMPQQIRTISKMRLLALIGRLTDASIQTTIENRVLEHLGIEFEPEEENDH